MTRDEVWNVIEQRGETVEYITPSYIRTNKNHYSFYGHKWHWICAVDNPRNRKRLQQQYSHRAYRPRPQTYRIDKL